MLCEAGGTFAGVGASEKLWGSDIRAHTGCWGQGLLELISKQISGVVLPSSSLAVTAPAPPDPSYVFSSTCPDEWRFYPYCHITGENTEVHRSCEVK